MGSAGLKDRFGNELRLALHKRYRRAPSAVFLALQFNQRCDQRNGISGETARRWIRGLSMPGYGHLEILAKWLNLDLVQIFIPAGAGGVDSIAAEREGRTFLLKDLEDFLKLRTKSERLSPPPPDLLDLSGPGHQAVGCT